MVTEYFILNSKLNDVNPNFYCFDSPFDVENKVREVFSEECQWTESQAFYKTELAHLKLEVLKIKKELPYIFQLTVLGGDNPLYEVVRLCRANSWNAYDIKQRKYLNLQNPPKIEITDLDKKKFYDDYWDKFNTIQEEQENKLYQEQENKNRAIRKKWWKFW